MNNEKNIQAKQQATTNGAEGPMLIKVSMTGANRLKWRLLLVLWMSGFQVLADPTVNDSARTASAPQERATSATVTSVVASTPTATVTSTSPPAGLDQVGTPEGVLPNPPILAAKAWMLFDVGSQEILAQHNIMQPIEPASITKVMTAYLVFDALRKGQIQLDQNVKVTPAVLKVQSDESRMFLKPNDVVTVDQLLKGLLVHSGNDAALMLAELVGGSQANFVQQMNDRAHAIGMKKTHFTNPIGLPDEEHYTTAQDLIRLAQAVLRDFPERYQYFSIREYAYAGISQRNRNQLLMVDSAVDGLKTGHTERAGYCLLASANRPMMNLPGKHRRLIAVVLGAQTEQDRANETLRLLNYGYQAYDNWLLYSSGQAIDSVRIFKGDKSTLTVTVPNDVMASVPKKIGQTAQQATQFLKPVLVTRKYLSAPLQKGAVVGYIQYQGIGQQHSIPVVAFEDAKEAVFYKRLLDGLKLFFAKLLGLG